MEKLPLGQRPEPRMVGRESREIKEKIKSTILVRFAEGHIAGLSPKDHDLLKTIEQPETIEEKEAIRVANEITNELLEQFGLQPFDIPEKNVHFIDTEENFKKLIGRDLDAATAYHYQGVFVNGERDKRHGDQAGISRALTILHEFLHLKGHISIYADAEKRGLDRMGLTALSKHRRVDRRDGEWSFNGLHEAVVSELEKKYTKAVLQKNRFLKKVIVESEPDETKKLKEIIATENKISPEEIPWILQTPLGDIRFGRYPYRKQREVLNYVVDKIYEDGNFNSRDSVMELFFRAQLAGNFLGIGRLVEESFGKGSFRGLGFMGDKPRDPSVDTTFGFLTLQRKLLLRRREAKLNH